MSMTPYEDEPAIQQDEEQSIVQRTELAPINKEDPPSKFRKFLDTIRTFVGMKPLYLSERYLESVVQEKEIDNAVKLLEAIGNYEVKHATAEKIRDQNKTSEPETTPKQPIATDKQVDNLLKKHSPEEAMKMLQDVMDKIQYTYNGRVELVPPKSIEGPDESLPQKG